MTAAAEQTWRPALVLMVFAAVGTAALAATYASTRERIMEAEDRDKLALVSEILPPTEYDNRVLRDIIKLSADPMLGTRESLPAYRARRQGAPVAVILEAVAPDGYGGKMRLLIAIRRGGELAGVRVVAHSETPGWGDYIESARSKWIHIFDGIVPDSLKPQDWQVRKDGGRFDYVTRATVSARAVVKGVAHAVQYHAAHADNLYSTELRVIE